MYNNSGTQGYFIALHEPPKTMKNTGFGHLETLP